jgi:hypothetical protein
VVLIVVGLVGTVVVGRRRSGNAVDPWSTRRSIPTPLPISPEVVSTGEIRVRSDTPDYRFLFSATVSWLPEPGSSASRHHNLAAVAAQTVIDRAVAVTRTIPPAEMGLARTRLEAALGLAESDGDRHVRAWAADVMLGLPEADAERLHTPAALRKPGCTAARSC